MTPLDSLIIPLELQPLLLPPRCFNVFGQRSPLAKLVGNIFLYFYFFNDVVRDGVPVPKVKPIKFRAKPVRQIHPIFLLQSNAVLRWESAPLVVEIRQHIVAKMGHMMTSGM